MGIKYLDDSDLMFFKFCDNDDLGILANILIGKEGDKRLCEELSDEDRFKNCNGSYQDAWDLIAGELQLFGGDSIANAARGGRGVLYREILADVCKKMGVRFDKEDDIQTIEKAYLLKILEKSLDKMTEKERAEFVAQFGLNVSNLAPAAIMAALQAAIRIGGFASYQLAVIVANGIARAITGRGLILAANAGLARILGIFSGPIGWVVTGLLSVPLLSGPAFRVTIPACVQVAYMRQKYMNNNFL